MDEREFQIEKLKLQHAKHKFWVGTVILGLVVLGVNYTYQSWKADRELSQQTNEHLAKYVNHVVNKDPEFRLHVATYFATLSVTESARGRWHKYAEIAEKMAKDYAATKIALDKSQAELTKRVDALAKAAAEFENRSDDKELAKKIKKLRGEVSAKQEEVKQTNMKLTRLRGREERTIRQTPWMDIALKEIGQKEVPGGEHNPRIIEYHSKIKLGPMVTDEIPWSSSFVNWVFEQVGIEGTHSGMARSWLTWGKPIIEPVYGCVVVLAIPQTPVGGHVGFLIDADAESVRVLGGNVKNSVGTSVLPKSRVLGYRWPG